MDHKELAMRIIETVCERKFSLELKNERVLLKHNTGRLSYGPFVSLDSVKVRSSGWKYAEVFGASDWLDIPTERIDVSFPVLVVSGGVLDGQFDEADVTYAVGYKSVPEPIASACDILMRQLQLIPNPHSYAVMSLITPEIMKLLSPYTKNGGESVENVIPHHRGIQASTYRY